MRLVSETETKQRKAPCYLRLFICFCVFRLFELCINTRSKGHHNGSNSSSLEERTSVMVQPSKRKQESTKPISEANSTLNHNGTGIGIGIGVGVGVGRDKRVLDKLTNWRMRRSTGWELYNSWFVNSTDGKGLILPESADGGSTGGGPILDFYVSGFPKCGTTAIMRTLATVTTMPAEEDVCTAVQNTVYYAYHNWANKYGNGAGVYNETKPLKGSKCPRTIEGPDLDALGRLLPKTNLIIGIRHPVLWFQSFVNMRWFYDKKRITLDEFVDKKLLTVKDNGNHKCDNNSVCVARARFHLSLARLGKTPLDEDERELLKSELFQARRRRNETSKRLRKSPVKDKEDGVPNKVFLFESSQGKEEYFYKDLAQFVNIDRRKLPPVKYKTGNGINGVKTEARQKATELFDVCSPKYDHVRKELLPISYTLGTWLLQYLIPASYERDDLVIPNAQNFTNLVEKFLRDPCDDRLVRNEDDGEYYLVSKEEVEKQ